MKFTGVCLVTPNVKRLRDFYQDVLQVAAEGELDFASFSTKGIELSIFSAQGMDKLAPGSMKGAGCGSYTLDFEVEDIEQEYERLKNMNVSFVKHPATYPWGRCSFWLRDPDGNIVNFYANVVNQQQSNITREVK